jgi:hypothetical protein
MAAMASTLLGRGIRRGLLGGQRRWLGILLIVLVGRLVRVATGRRSAVQSTRLEPGETLEVRHMASGDAGR